MGLNTMNQVQPDLSVSQNLNTNEIGASISFDENEITQLLLDMVNLAEDNGLRLPREFGLLVKQSLYFDRYLKILAPNLDVVGDERVTLGGGGVAGGQKVNGLKGDGNNEVNVIIDV